MLFIYIFRSYSNWFFALLLVGWVAAFIYVFRDRKHKIWFFLSAFFLVLFSWFILHFAVVQNWLVSGVTARLSKDLKTKVSINHVDLSFFNKMSLKGVLVEDQKKDTLLFAGAAEVNITDWFFFKDNATLKYIGLTDAVVNINRTDSVWNYQFLIDYFAVPKKDTNSRGSNIEFDLKVMKLENVLFNKSDKWVGQDMKIAIQKLDLNADTINFSRKHIYISELKLDAPLFLQSNYTGNRPKPDSANLRTVMPKIPVLSALQWNTGGWMVSIKNIDLNNASFYNERQTTRDRYTDQFDGQHLAFTGITGNLKNVLFINDTLTTDLKIKAKEQSGLEVKNLQAKVKFTPDQMEFSKLLLETNKSRVGNYFVMRYKNFNDDLSSFLHNVTLEGNFQDAEVHSDDIAFFAPKLKTWNRVFYFQGNTKGTVDNLSGKKMIIKSGNSTIDGDITLKGLPDINTTFIDFRANDLQTNYNDLVTLIPSLKDIHQPQLRQLGNIRFKGNYTGFIRDFVAFGNISTSLGNLNADINMKLPENGTATYSGKISSGGFNLGRFFNNNDLGNIALDGTVKGSGFSIKNLNADFDGKIHHLEYAGYPYKNITVKGNFIKNIFNGHLDMDDPNLKIENLNGSVSLLGDTSKFNFDAIVHKADLQKLKLTGEQFTLSGLFSLNFVGNNIDNFLGTAKVYNATLTHDTTRMSFDSLTLRSLTAGTDKILTVESNEVEGTLTGKFKIMELPDAFKVFLNRYYPAYIKKPGRDISDQDFSFLIKTRQVDEYVKMLDKRLGGFNNSVFSGNLKLAQNELNVNAQVPEFSYDGKRFADINLVAKGNLDSLNTTISVSDVAITDSLHFPNSTLVVSSRNDISDIQLTTKASKTLSDAQLNARVQTLADGVKINFSPSSFILNDKKWELAKDGELTLRQSYIEANDVKFTQGEQEIVISTELDELTDHTNLVAKLKKVNINDFTPLFFTQPRLEGALTGTLKFKDPFGKKIVEYDAYAEDLVLDNKKIGKVNLKGEANTTTGLIKLKADADGLLYKFNVDGSFNYKDSSENQMDIAFLAERFDISLLDNYLGSIFSDMQGNANSNLRLSGGKDHRYMTGSVTITEGSLKVKYTQVKYNFTNETVIFNPDEIDLGTLQLRDTLNNTGTASGKMQHRFFQEFSFENLRFETGKMLLLNTTKRDNSQFYGKVLGQAQMTLTGPVTDMRMNITGQPSLLDTSHIFIPSSSSQEIGKIDYIDFIQYGSKMEDDIRGRQESNMVVNMNITANPACKIDVILDESTGDVIKGRGNGQLNIRVGTREPLTIRGKYDITDGQYTFNFQSWLKRYFIIKNGSINWNGDPYLAQINIDAEYEARKVDLSNLSSVLKQKEDVTIIAHIRGILNAPEISFDFQLPANSEVGNNFLALNKLEAIRQDKNEANKQVASLLLFNTFISADDQGFLTSGNTIGLATNTIGGIVSGWLTNLFNKELEKATNGALSTYFDISSSFDLQNKAALLQGNLSAGVKITLTSRLVVLIGGNLDYNNPYAQLNRRGLLTPDINIEWSLNNDGSLKVVGFNRTSIDLTQGQRNRSGIKLSYRKDFDRLSDIFAPSEEKKRRRAARKEAKVEE
jgi:TamB, inner membrane protein subunit of TAM complex